MNIIQLSEVFLFTGYIILLIGLSYPQNLSIGITANIFQFIGVWGIVYSSFTEEENKNIIIYSSIVLLLLSYMIFLNFYYGDKISKLQVPDVYYSLSISSQCLLFIEIMMLIFNNLISLPLLGFIMVINLIILIIETSILSKYITDG